MRGTAPALDILDPGIQLGEPEESDLSGVNLAEARDCCRKVLADRQDSSLDMPRHGRGVPLSILYSIKFYSAEIAVGNHVPREHTRFAAIAFPRQRAKARCETPVPRSALWVRTLDVIRSARPAGFRITRAGIGSHEIHDSRDPAGERRQFREGGNRCPPK